MVRVELALGDDETKDDKLSDDGVTDETTATAGGESAEDEEDGVGDGAATTIGTRAL